MERPAPGSGGVCWPARRPDFWWLARSSWQGRGRRGGRQSWAEFRVGGCRQLLLAASPGAANSRGRPWPRLPGDLRWVSEAGQALEPPPPNGLRHRPLPPFLPYPDEKNPEVVFRFSARRAPTQESMSLALLRVRLRSTHYLGEWGLVAGSTLTPIPQASIPRYTQLTQGGQTASSASPGAVSLAFPAQSGHSSWCGGRLGRKE